MSRDQALERIHFERRLANLIAAFDFLNEVVVSETPPRIKNAAMIKAFDLAFDLSWKSAKDLLEAEGGVVSTPRKVIMEAAKAELLIDDQGWIELPDQRNSLVHVYDDARAAAAVAIIRDRAVPLIQSLLLKLQTTRSRG